MACLVGWHWTDSTLEYVMQTKSGNPSDLVGISDLKKRLGKSFLVSSGDRALCLIRNKSGLRKCVPLPPLAEQTKLKKGQTLVSIEYCTKGSNKLLHGLQDK
jgi:hypothetical protein